MVSLINLLYSDLRLLLHSWDHHLLLLVLLGCLFLLSLHLVLVEVIFLRSERSHGDHQVSESSLELFPVFSVVEQLDGECLHLRLVQVGEHLHDGLDEQLDHGISVGAEVVSLTVSHLDWLEDHVILGQLHKLLEDLALKFEAGQVVAIRHHCQSLSDDECVEADIENCTNTWD